MGEGNIAFHYRIDESRLINLFHWLINSAYHHIFYQSEVDVPFFTVLSPGQVQALPRGERGRLARDGLCQSHRLHGHGHLPAACAFRMGRWGRLRAELGMGQKL